MLNIIQLFLIVLSGKQLIYIDNVISLNNSRLGGYVDPSILLSLK